MIRISVVRVWNQTNVVVTYNSFFVSAFVGAALLSLDIGMIAD